MVGVVEPERASLQVTKLEQQTQQLTEQVREEMEGEAEEDREAVSETRVEKSEETAEEEVAMEEAGQLKDATKEQADTTQKMEEGRSECEREQGAEEWRSTTLKNYFFIFHKYALMFYATPLFKI